MATSNASSGNDVHHKRAKSTVLKSIMGNRQHKRDPSAGDALEPQIYDENQRPSLSTGSSKMMVSLPNDHPHAFQIPLGELAHNQLVNPVARPGLRTPGRERTNPMEGASYYAVTADTNHSPPTSPHTREKLSKNRSDSQATPAKSKKPKNMKSHTGLGALLSRPKSSKGKDEARQDKESAIQRSTSIGEPAQGTAPPSIYAQFASRPVEPGPDISGDRLNGAQIEQEISRYTPANYSPSKQRDFGQHEQPTLGRRGAGHKARPKSEYLTSSTTGTVVKDALQALRRSSNDSTHASVSSRKSSEQKKRPNSIWGGRDANAPGTTSRSPSGEQPKRSSTGEPEKSTVAKRGSRVMAAVAALNMKAKEGGKDKGKDKLVPPQDIEGAFEALLDSRNVPQNMRQKLRSLDTRIKANFIRQDKAGGPGLPRGVTSPFTSSLAAQGSEDARPGRTDRPVEIPVPGTPQHGQEEVDSTSPRKRNRGRSKTFMHRGDKDGSPLKKQKSNENASLRVKSSEYRPGSSSKPRTAAGGSDVLAQGLGKGPKHQAPQDFVGYMRQVQDPRRIEVGKLHKLRLVLRNERVAWVEEFLSIGGMTEVVALLRRIMAVEWREEHEDALLHEVLLCLKALCTTKSALRELDNLQDKLFPQLVGMIFDDDRKGPSEFNTRGIIFSLLLTYLADAHKDQLAPRAASILSYLRDPGPPAHSQPLGFIQSMHQPRPYKVWCREICSVTKEVFWIFLHQTNVVPVVGPTETTTSPLASDPTSTVPASASNEASYADLHFPKERPPVPAAPYVGGVEWDATNYVSTHLDLVNGLIASFGTTTERNAVRQDLRVSGLEKMMGSSLRTCKEKFYGSVHDGLKTWVAAALADGWDVDFVRRGPSADASSYQYSSSPEKKMRKGNVAASQAANEDLQANGSPVKNNKKQKNGIVGADLLKVDLLPLPKLDLELSGSGSADVPTGITFSAPAAAAAAAAGDYFGPRTPTTSPMTVMWD